MHFQSNQGGGLILSGLNDDDSSTISFSDRSISPTSEPTPTKTKKSKKWSVGRRKSKHNNSPSKIRSSPRRGLGKLLRSKSSSPQQNSDSDASSSLTDLLFAHTQSQPASFLGALNRQQRSPSQIIAGLQDASDVDFAFVGGSGGSTHDDDSEFGLTDQLRTNATDLSGSDNDSVTDVFGGSSSSSSETATNKGTACGFLAFTSSGDEKKEQLASKTRSTALSGGAVGFLSFTNATPDSPQAQSGNRRTTLSQVKSTGAMGFLSLGANDLSSSSGASSSATNTTKDNNASRSDSSLSLSRSMSSKNIKNKVRRRRKKQAADRRSTKPSTPSFIKLKQSVVEATKRREVLREEREQAMGGNLNDVSAEATAINKQLFLEASNDNSLLMKPTQTASASNSDHGVQFDQPCGVQFEACTLEKLLYATIIHHPTMSCNTDSVWMAMDDFTCLDDFLNQLSLVDLLLVSYRPLVTPERLFSLLQHAWELFASSRESIIRLLEVWIGQCFFDFRQRKQFLGDVFAFISGPIDRFSAEKSEQLLIAIKQQLSAKEGPFVAPKVDTTAPNVFQIMSPAEIALAMTAADHEVFVKIKPIELLVWPHTKTKEEKQSLAPNVVAMINQFNFWHYLTATHVLLSSNPKQRAIALQRVIALAQECKKLYNLSALTSIFSAIQGSAVGRLKATWLHVSKASKRTVKSLKKFVSSSNYAAYREFLATAQRPCIPHIGMTMSDMTFINDGNDDFVEFQGQPTDLVNMNKVVMIARNIFHVCFFTSPSFHYPLVSAEKIKQVRTQPVLTNDALYKRSLKLEPRRSHR